MIDEPDVTLTDYGLALECALFTILLARYRRDGSLAPWFMLFFASIGVAALAGGTVHGFIPDKTSPAAAVLWILSLLALGVTALGAWVIGARMQWSAAGARWVQVAAVIVFGMYGLAVLVLTQAFWIAIVNYVPATAFLLVVWTLAYRRSREGLMLLGVIGLTLTFVAAGVQMGRIALHPVYFNHNALYHLVQAVALLMIFLGCRPFTVSRSPIKSKESGA